jgi:heme-degrading monooxygenase HmoA
MPYILIRHKVEDYGKYKTIFDQDAANRKASGSLGGQLFHNANNPNEVVFLCEWDDLEKAQQFSQSDDLREKMQQAGVSDHPDVYFLEEIEQLSH